MNQVRIRKHVQKNNAPNNASIPVKSRSASVNALLKITIYEIVRPVGAEAAIYQTRRIPGNDNRICHHFKNYTL